ncbi:hypothetical protein ZWY2020_009410 [Hordeum vulgare]|nr:hypothetical protein ZWY2020_009410 [Hordeum vulgare]
MDFKLPAKLTEEEESTFIPVFSQLRSLTNNGLTGIDLARCWVEWRILPLSRRDGLMCEYDGSENHPQCFFHTRLTEEDIVEMIRKLTSEPLENCTKIGLKTFCLSNPAPPKGSTFWSRRPKVTVQKTTKSPPKKKKKKKKKGKAATKESSVVGESRAGEEQSEEKKRKTGDLSSAPKITEVFGMSTFVPELDEDPATTHDDLVDDVPDVPTDPPSPLKETTENVNPPSSSKAVEDPDTVIVTSTGYSKPAEAMLTKHESKETHASAEQDITELKLPMMRVKHEESFTRAESSLADLKQNLAKQQNARTKGEEKYKLALADMEKMKADHQKFEKKAHADQAAIMKRVEKLTRS